MADTCRPNSASVKQSSERPSRTLGTGKVVSVSLCMASRDLRNVAEISNSSDCNV